MQGIPRQLDEEGFACLLTGRHECCRAVSHAKNVNRIGVGEAEGMFVAGVAVVSVVAMPARATAANVPFAEVGGRIAGGLQEFADCQLGISNASRATGFNQLTTGFGWSCFGPVHLRRALAGLETDAGGRADRCRSVGGGESHALSRELGQSGCVDGRRAAGWHLWVHCHRKAVPGLIVGEHEDNVRLRGRNVDKRRTCQQAGSEKKNAHGRLSGCVTGITVVCVEGCRAWAFGLRPPGRESGH